MRKVRRVFALAIGIAAGFLVLTVSFAAFLLTTQPGAALVVGYLEGRLPLEFTVGDVDGRLVGPLELHDARMMVSGVAFEVDRLLVNWRPVEFLSERRVHLQTVRIEGLRTTVRDKVRGDPPQDSTSSTEKDALGTDSITLPVQLVFDDLRVIAGSVSVAGSFEAREIDLWARGAVDSYAIDLTAVAELPDLPTSRVRASGTGSLSSISLDSLRSDLLHGQIRAWGSLSWIPQLTWQLAVEADTLAPADLMPTPDDWPGRLSFAANTRGVVGNGRPSLRVDVDTLYGMLRGQPIAGSLAGTIEGPEYEISHMDLDWGRIRIDAAGGVSRQRLALEFELEAPDLNAALPGASGSVEAAGTLAGSPSSPQMAAFLQARDLSVGDVRLDSARAVLDVDWAAGSRNDAQVTLSGMEIADRAVNSATIELRGSKESHRLTAGIIGDSASVTLEASGGLRDKSWQGEVGQLTIETAAAGDWQIERSFRLAVSSGSVELDEACLAARVGKLCLGGSWSAESGWGVGATSERLPLTLLQPVLPDGWSVAAPLSGKLAGAGIGQRVELADLNVQIASGALEYPSGGPAAALGFNAIDLRIYADADSLAGDFTVELADTSGDGAGTLSGQGSLPGSDLFTQEIVSEGFIEALQDDWRLALSIDTVSLSLFDRFLPEAMRLTGSLNGALVALAASDGELTAQLEVIPVEAALVRTIEQEVRRLEIVDPALRMRIDSAGLWGEAMIAAARPDSAPHVTLSGTLHLPRYTNLSQPVQSETMRANLNGAVDLGLLDALIDEFSGTVGRLGVDLAARGTLAEPEVSGRYDVVARTDVPSLGIQLRDVEVTAVARPEGNLDITGGLSSGDGRLEITGEAPIIPSSESPGRLKVRGANFLAAQTDQTTLVMSPDLEVVWTGTSVGIAGDVTVPRATIEIIEIPETSVGVSEDVVLVGAESQPSRPMDVSADIRLRLGDEILFKGFGFTTNVEGTLQLIEQPGIATQGRGELVLREGVYRGYGQNLSIDPGRLVFAGPIDDPGLSVRAYRRATDGTRAGFLIGGTLKSPELEVWSDPAMSESAVLSYVLFGRSPEDGSGSQQVRAGGAAAILGGNVLAMSMASRVGLDDARVEAGARQEDAALYAGKYLSPKLYVAYGTGLFEPIDVIRIRYLISNKLTLQAETGTRDSGDILYRIER